jgi:hypothetical protein
MKTQVKIDFKKSHSLLQAFPFSGIFVIKNEPKECSNNLSDSWHPCRSTN